MYAAMRKIASAFVFIFSASILMGQVATGTYPYGTFDSKGFDTINVGNLNAHFAIPILSKAGRGVPFIYNLGYDSSIWTPVSVSGSTHWQPVGGLGWSQQTAAISGYVTATSTDTITGSGTCSMDTTTYSNYIYHDPLGRMHPFMGTTWTRVQPCLHPPIQNSANLNTTTTDGSGYSIVANEYVWTITSPSGAVLSGPTNTETGSGTYTDPNGNEITATTSGQTTQFKDTTGNVALTIGGSGSPSSPTTFTYTDTTGTPRAVTMTYQTYTVQTAFGCSGVGEYGPTATSLVSSISFPDGSTYNFTYEATPGVSGNVTGRLAGVQLRQGGTIQYVYSGGSEGIECADGSTAGLTRSLNADSGSAASTWSYARTSPNGAGTSQTTVVDGLGNNKTYNFVQASNLPAGTTAVYYETSRKVYNGAASGTPVVARNTCYNGAASPCTTASFTLPVSQIDTYKTLDGIETDGRTAKYNVNGMQTEADVYDFGASSRGGLLRKEVWTYGYSVPSAVTQDEVFDGSGNEGGNTTYVYDGTAVTPSSGVPQHVAVTGARGNLTSMTQYASSGTSYVSSATYEDTGSLLTSTTPTGTTTLTYDPTFVYNTGATLPTPSSGVPLGASESFDTTNTGLPLSMTDANGQATQIPSYDAMLRPTEVEYPDGGMTTLSYSPTWTAMNTPATNGTTQTQYDGYGRTSRTAIANGQTGYYQQDVCYNANGNAVFKSYRYTGAGFGAGKVCSGAGDTYTYDVLGRVTKVARANGETRLYTYLGRATEAIDENNVTRISQVDGLGRTTTVCEISSNTLQGVSPVVCGTDIPGTGFATSYGYALATGTTTITQGAQTRTFVSDWLGRPTSVTEPESGTTTYGYAYYPTGLQVMRTRPKANQTSSSVTTTTTTQYDSLGRPISITYSDGTLGKGFAYDVISGLANGKGRLLSAWVNGTADSYYSYDPMGRIVYLGECLPPTCGVAYGQSYTYDLAGDEISSTDGAGVTSTYAYSPAGEILSLTSSRSDATDPVAILSGVQNGPFGPVSYNLGNGLSENYIYDALGRLQGGWLCNGGDIVPGCSGGTQFYGFEEGWKGKQVTSLCDTVQNECSTYGYDEFNRLTSLTVSPQTPQNYTYVYDRYGNRWQQNPLNGGWSSQLGFNMATNQINTAGYAYDAAGNMTNDGFHTYTYDAEGHITAVDGGQTATYVYNALNQRVQATVGGTVTNYVYNAAGQRVSEWNGATNAQIKGKYYWGAKPVAYYANGAVHFEHQDWLGTERMRTTYNGGVEGSFSSLPFGDGQTTTGADTDANHYAQLDHDARTDTDYAQFRQYSNAQGRWLSPDPYSGSYELQKPQSFNRYVYAGNNPLEGVDPTGLQLCSITSCGWNKTGDGREGNPLDPGGDGSIWSAAIIGTLVSNLGDTYSDNKNTYTLTANGWVDQNGNVYSSAAANEVGLPSLMSGFIGFMASSPQRSTAPVLLAQNNAPNNTQTQDQKNQQCLDEINSTPDGKFYNFFSAASPWLAPDTLAWDTTAAAAGGTVGFLNAAARNWSGTPLGTASGAVADTAVTAARRYLYLAVVPATVGQLTVHSGCWIASHF